MKKSPGTGAFFHLSLRNQNKELSATEKKLSQAQTIMPTTNVIGNAVLLKR
jgi:hypothetical protein